MATVSESIFCSNSSNIPSTSCQGYSLCSKGACYCPSGFSGSILLKYIDFCQYKNELLRFIIYEMMLLCILLILMIVGKIRRGYSRAIENKKKDQLRAKIIRESQARDEERERQEERERKAKSTERHTVSGGTSEAPHPFAPKKLVDISHPSLRKMGLPKTNKLVQLSQKVAAGRVLSGSLKPGTIIKEDRKSLEGSASPHDAAGMTPISPPSSSAFATQSKVVEQLKPSATSPSLLNSNSNSSTKIPPTSSKIKNKVVPIHEDKPLSSTASFKMGGASMKKVSIAPGGSRSVSEVVKESWGRLTVVFIESLFMRMFKQSQTTVLFLSIIASSLILMMSLILMELHLGSDTDNTHAIVGLVSVWQSFFWIQLSVVGFIWTKNNYSTASLKFGSDEEVEEIMRSMKIRYVALWLLWHCVLAVKLLGGSLGWKIFSAEGEILYDYVCFALCGCLLLTHMVVIIRSTRETSIYLNTLISSFFLNEKEKTEVSKLLRTCTLLMRFLLVLCLLTVAFVPLVINYMDRFLYYIDFVFFAFVNLCGLMMAMTIVMLKL